MNAKDAAIHCEVKKIALVRRQRKEGEQVVLTLLIHPDEVPEDLWLTHVGQRYMMALAAIGDQGELEPGPATLEGMEAIKIAGALCRNVRFQRWSGSKSEEEAVKWLHRELKILTRSDLRDNPEARAEFWAVRDRFEDAYRRGLA